MFFIGASKSYLRKAASFARGKSFAFMNLAGCCISSHYTGVGYAKVGEPHPDLL